MNTSIKLLSAGSFLLCSTTLSAAPVVTGNTITWPDDGWYQVQSASDYSQICAGVQSCTVDAGIYIVINHTTGQRFENVVVDAEADDDSGITVSDGVISWPDNGWYQVQRSDTYESLCNGGRSCAVEDGSYIVINHTTGQRYPGVEVGSTVNPVADAVVVEGNTISWLDEGWYQVQTVPGYESICNGGSSCTVVPGDYVVINHSTQTRTAVTIEGGETVIPSNVAINSGNYKDIISSVLQVYTGSPEYTDDMYAIPSLLEIDASTAPGDYYCTAGGSVTVSYYSGIPEDGLNFDFNDCVEGATLMEGSLTVFQSSYVLTAESYSEKIAGKYGATLKQSFSGSVSRSPGQWSAQALNYHHYESVDITEGDYSWGRVISGDGAFWTSISGSFSYADASSDSDVELSAEATGLSIGLSSEDTLALLGSYDVIDATPFMDLYPEEGTLEITADDGSRLLMNAATGDMSTVSITIENDGESVSLLEPWSNWSAELRTDVLEATR